MKNLVLAFFGFIFLLSATPVSAQEIRATWQTKKVLVINTNGYNGGELETTKRRFAIGPSEWFVRYERQANGSTYTPVYEETWRLPTLPDCYRPAGRPACLPGGAIVRNYLWSIGYSFFTNGNTPNFWTFEELDPATPSLYTNISNKARGSAVLGGVNSDNIHNVVSTGAYGWTHAMFENGNNGAMVWSGTMIPLRWEITGVNYED